VELTAGGGVGMPVELAAGGGVVLEQTASLVAVHALKSCPSGHTVHTMQVLSSHRK